MDDLVPIIDAVFSAIDADGIISPKVREDNVGLHQDVVHAAEEGLTMPAIAADVEGLFHAVEKAEKITDRESLWSYIGRVSSIVRSMSQLHSEQSPKSTSEVFLTTLLRAWKALLSAFWTFHVDLVNFASECHERQRLYSDKDDDQEIDKQAEDDVHLLCLVICSCALVRYLNSVLSIVLVVLAQHSTPSRDSSVQERLAETLAIVSLLHGVQLTVDVDMMQVLTEQSAHEREYQLKSLGSLHSTTTDTTPTLPASSHRELLPAYLLPTTTLNTLLARILRPSPLITSIATELESTWTQLVTLHLTSLNKSNSTMKGQPKLSEREKDLVRRDAVESIVSQTTVMLARHWNHGESSTSRDLSVAIAVLHLLLSLQRWKSALSLPSLQLTMTSVVALSPIAWRLLEHFEDSSHDVGAYLLFLVVRAMAGAHVSAVADWIAPKVTERLRIITSETARLLLHHVFLTLSLCSVSSAAVVDRGNSQARATAVALTQLTGEYLERSFEEISREFQPKPVWRRWVEIEHALRLVPIDIVVYYVQAMETALLHTLNVWHLGLQRYLLELVLPMLLQRLPAVSEGFAIKLFTEIMRVYIFYTRNVTPDLSLATAEQRTVMLQTVRETWQRLQRGAATAFSVWKEATESTLKRQIATEVNRDKVESLQFLQQCLEKLTHVE